MDRALGVLVVVVVLGAVAVLARRPRSSSFLFEDEDPRSGTFDILLARRSSGLLVFGATPPCPVVFLDDLSRLWEWEEERLRRRCS